MPVAASPELSVWCEDADGCWQAVRVTDPIGWGTAGLSSVELWSPAADDLVIQPIEPTAGAIGALIVGGQKSRHVAINGIPAPAGMYILSHADRVEVDQQTLWFSCASTVQETEYDPALHGDDVRCFLTKARLVPGKQIKICPGVPGAICGVIYTAEAWDLAMKSSRPLRCPNCGFRSDEPEWAPPTSKKRKAIDGILQLIAK